MRKLSSAKVRELANAAHHELTKVIAGERLELTYRNCTDWKDSGFSSGASGGGSGHGDPVAVKVLARFERQSPDAAAHDLQRLQSIVQIVTPLLVELDKLIVRNTTPTKEMPPEYDVMCDNMACRQVVKPGEIVDGECSKCRKHRSKYHLPWPKKHTVQRDGTLKEVG